MNHEEDAIQAAAIAQYQVRGTSNSVLFAIPNGEKRDKATDDKAEERWSPIGKAAGRVCAGVKERAAS